jgi:D-alanine-D-alanine ligase
VKPARGGSALGIRFASDPDEVSVALAVALAYDREALVERFVEGRDIAVSVIEADGALVALPVVEARPRERDFYDFEARYTPGATVFDAPAALSPDAADEAQRLAVSACTLLGLRGPARIDLMLDGNGGWWVLEANAVPGMTDTSLLPLAAEAAGMSFDKLVATVLAGALEVG